MIKNRIIYLENKLKKTHFDLIEKTLIFIKNNSKKPIHKKDDPKIFIDLLKTYSLESKTEDVILTQKILHRIRTRHYMEDCWFNLEILNLLVLPLSLKESYFTVLHFETLENSTNKLLSNYFKFIENDLNAYLLTGSQIMNLKVLLTKNNKKGLIKKIQSLKYSNNKDLWVIRKSLNPNFDSEKVLNTTLKSKHLFLTVQLILIKNTLKSQTYEEIYFFRNLLTDFLFLSKLVT